MGSRYPDIAIVAQVDSLGLVAAQAVFCREYPDLSRVHPVTDQPFAGAYPQLRPPLGDAGDPLFQHADIVHHQRVQLSQGRVVLEQYVTPTHPELVIHGIVAQGARIADISVGESLQDPFRLGVHDREPGTESADVQVVPLFVVLDIAGLFAGEGFRVEDGTETLGGGESVQAVFVGADP